MQNVILKHTFSYPLFFSVLFIFHFLPSFAQTQEECIKNLNQAQREWDDGNIEKAIELIQPCLKNPNVADSTKGKGYRLLGLVYIGQQLVKEANEAVKNLLLMVPNYKINPDIDPPPLKKIIDDITPSLEPKITSITPNTVDQESNGFILKVYGTNFVYGSAIKFNGIEKTTTHVSASELNAEIPASYLLEDGEFDVNVYSPIAGGRTSAPYKFQVISKSSFPWTWVSIGGGAVVATVIYLLIDTPPPPVVVYPIAEPPSRP